MNDGALQGIRRVFISHTANEDVSLLLQALQDLRLDVFSADMLVGPVPIHQAVIDAIRESDALIAVVTKLTSNALVEVGIALGMGIPILLVSDRAVPLPTDLSLAPRWNPVSGPEQLRSALETSIRTTSKQIRAREPRAAPALTRERADEFRLAAATAHPVGLEVELLVRRIFESAGARVLQESRQTAVSRPVSHPDLIVWHKDLLAGFGLPVPVEVLVRSSAVRGVLGRLRRTLLLSGARSLLAVYLGSEVGGRPRTWDDDEGRFILAVSVLGLIESLGRLPLADALAAVRADAVDWNSEI